MSTYIVVKKLETKTATISLCNDGIVRVLLKSNSVIDVPELRVNNFALNELVKGTKYSFLYYPEDGSVTHSDDARAFGKKHENAVPRLCTAVVVNSLAHKLVANFYLKFNKPAIPFKVFSHMDDAEAWCYEQNKRYSANTPNTTSVLF